MPAVELLVYCAEHLSCSSTHARFLGLCYRIGRAGNITMIETKGAPSLASLLYVQPPVGRDCTNHKDANPPRSY